MSSIRFRERLFNGFYSISPKSERESATTFAWTMSILSTGWIVYALFWILIESFPSLSDYVPVSDKTLSLLVMLAYILAADHKLQGTFFGIPTRIRRHEKAEKVDKALAVVMAVSGPAFFLITALLLYA